MKSGEFLLSDRRSWSFDRLFDAAKKDTVIRLRWPLVILSSYLLYYAPSHWLTPSQVQSLLILYLLSHATLYFLADELFDSPYVYGPLLLFDTSVLLVVLEIGGSATPDFYVACLLTLVLSCVCNDTRGLLAVTILAPLIYGYSLFNSAVDLDQDVYLRLPFPLVISLFYGYFAQVDRLRKGAREKDELAKRQQQTAEELRHTHDIKDEFLRSVSTKLKTPLSVITGYADMFRTGLLGATTPIQEKAIETVSRQAKELQGLINSVLLVTYMETEPLHAELRDLDLWELLSELRAKYSDPPGKPVRLVWKYPADLPAVQGDRGKFKRILENLIDNALQFTDRGSITVAIQYSAASESLEIKVSDSGVGIPTTKLATIFDRFRQADSVDAGLQRGGFGLGLYIVKKYLDLLGGSMHVDSRVGEGSTFSLQIPAPMGKRLATHEPVSSANGRYRRKILLALKTREKKSPRRPGG